MIGVPQRFAAAFAKFPLFEELPARGEIQLAHVPPQRDGVHAALRADAAIAREDFIAKISWVGSQLPFMNACPGAEGSAAFGNFGPAPSAERAARWTAFERGGHGPSARFGSRRAWCQSIIFPQMRPAGGGDI